MTSLPTWAVWVLAFGSPALAFVGVVIGQAITRRGARELEVRSKREEVMRILRWAAELAVSDDQAHARLGVAQLGALLESELLDEEEKDFVQAALTAMVRVPVQQIEQLGEDVQVVTESDLPVEPGADVPSGTEAAEERGDS
ncbi:MAG TPA: hypothetical protein VGQ05_13425 [Streptosporangiaceae bacterium]|nr:hypothetical protein [Streptosporangiaceae bacterium]